MNTYPELPVVDANEVSLVDESRALETTTGAVGAPRPLGRHEPALAAGTRIGRYVLHERLGVGGMGSVYAAEDPVLARRVALKILHAEHGARHGQEGLVREAQAMARLSHPNVVRVHDITVFGEDRVIVAMELVEGVSLSRWLQSSERAFEEIWSTFRAAGEGLAAAHDAGITHGDFKPDNVLVAQDGRVRVADFGISRSGARAPDVAADLFHPPRRELPAPVSVQGMVLGTAPYMAPEQHRGEPASASSDQFSFGVSLYEALYAQRPFTFPDAIHLRWHLPDEPVNRRQPLAVRALLARALARHRRDRFASMRALLTAMDQAQARTRRRRWPWVLAGLLMVSAVTALALARARLSPCEDAAADIRGAWNPARATAVTQAFVAGKAPNAVASSTRLRARLDGYASQWAKESVAECRAARARPSSTASSAQRDCLERRLSELDAFVQALSPSKPAVLGKALKASLELPDVALCANPAALEGGGDPPRSGEQHQRVERARAELARADALRKLGLPEDAEERARAVEKEALALEYLPLRAEALLVRGQALVNRGAQTAVAPLEEAVRLAMASRDDAVAVHAADLLAVYYANAGDEPQALKWSFVARPLISRLGEPLDLRAEYWAAYPAGEGQALDAAIAGTQLTLDELERAGRNDEELTAKLLNTQGLNLLAREDYARAAHAFDRSEDIWVQLVGARHPSAAVGLLNQTLVPLHEEQYPRVVELTERCRSVAEETIGRATTLYGNCTFNQGLALFYLGDAAGAAARFQDAYEVDQQLLGAGSTVGRYALYYLIRSELEGGKPALAARHADEVVREARNKLGALAPQLTLGRAMQALARARLGRPDARKTLEDVAALSTKGLEPSDLTTEQLLLAQGFWAIPGGHLRAHQLGKAALAAAQAHASNRAQLHEAERWLANHRG